MPKFTVQEEFDIAIKAAARTDGRKVSSRQLAEEFYDSERDLIRPFEKEWMIEKITSVLARERGRLTQTKDARRQLGFGRVGKIALDSGKYYRDSEATLWVLQQLRKQLGATDHPAIAEVVKRIEFLRPFAREKRGITLLEAIKRSAAKESEGR